MTVGMREQATRGVAGKWHRDRRRQLDDNDTAQHGKGTLIGPDTASSIAVAAADDGADDS